jgi:hypothetical protein
LVVIVMRFRLLVLDENDRTIEARIALGHGGCVTIASAEKNAIEGPVKAA